MDLSKYDGKHVRVTDKWGENFTGMAEYGNYDFLECEYGGEEDGILAENQIGIFAVSTYNTDYILVKAENFDWAMEALSAAGYEVEE